MRTTVLTIGCYPSSGGPSKSVRAFQRALNANVIAWVDPREHAKEALVFQPSAVVRGTEWPPLRSVLYPRSEDLPAAEEIIAASELVSCHLFWRWHCPWLHTIARRHGLPFWLVPHGGLDPYVFRKNGVAKRIFAKTVARPFLTTAPAVVCSTRREYEKARQHLPRAEPFILPWPLEQSDFRIRDEGRRHATRAQLGIPENSLCLLYLGRLHSMKRPLETISALARSGVDNAHLVIVGNEFGITMDDCNAHARREGVSGRVHVVGPAFGNNRHAYFDAADAYISLSHRENFNFSAAEALASGLPVVLSPGNDLASDLVEIDCGWMLHRIEAAPEVIRMASELPVAALADRGRRGKEWAEKSLAFDTFAARLQGYAARLAR